ncbi:MAG: glycosyltransferase [Pseudomonadota bacterium]
MGISELRQAGFDEDGAPSPIGSLDRELVKDGALSVRDAGLARYVQRHCDASLERVLIAEGLVDEEEILEAQARLLRSRRLQARELEDLQPLDLDVEPHTLLTYAILPVTDRDGEPALICGEVRSLSSALAHFPNDLRRARLLVAPRGDVLRRITAVYRAPLAEAAATRVPPEESCRVWSAHRQRRINLLFGLMVLICLAAIQAPYLTLALFMGWAALTLVVAIGFRVMAAAAAFTAAPARKSYAHAGSKREGDQNRAEPKLPRVSILVPLYRETEIAHALIARLTQLTYPKCLLDVVLVLEEKDALTQKTLSQIDLPTWIRVVIVPDGAPRTKPRAMNFAMDFCEGDIVGILDAEDAPAPDQITRVVRHFQTAPPEVACVQGVLDFYNPRQNWLARCFTIEYATWFRTLLPGMAHLGFAIPLGGTTLYMRRAALEALGGWDAHNVTEDADLGFRLARHGYATEMVATVTDEEANCRPWAWVKQRSRWLKGYMTTYLVHMRQPRTLYRQLGAWKFWGFQAHFITAVSQVLLAPVLWSFWLAFLGLPHPLDAYVSRDVTVSLGALFLAVELTNLAIYALSVSGPKHRHLMLWVPTMHFYWPLGAIAAYKALYELVAKPFFWDKTTHGLSLSLVPAPVRRADEKTDIPPPEPG